MLSKSSLKYVNSLQIKKFRYEHHSFLVEGAKSVQELLHSDFEIETVFGTEFFYKENSHLLTNFELVSQTELEKLGTFATNNAALAVAKIPKNIILKPETKEWILVLDDIKDPGNLGTIIRIADWYGITKIICSENCVDFYNPKVIAASMGSFLRVKCFYTNLLDYFAEIDAKNIVGTVLNGDNLYEYVFPENGFLVIGNESKGISEEIEQKLTKKVFIPRFGGAESLNAGIATAIVLDNLRRK